MNSIDTEIYNLAIQAGIPAPVAIWIVCQARLETGNYTSAAFTLYFNCFGYDYVGQAGAYDSGLPNDDGDGNDVAGYDGLDGSVIELVGWLTRRQNQGLFQISSLTSAKSYAEALKAGGYYKESSDQYASDLQTIYGQIGGGSVSNQAGGGKMAGIGLLIGLGLLFSLLKRK